MWDNSIDCWRGAEFNYVFDQEANIQISVSTQAFLFGASRSVPQARMNNAVLLFVKFYIYRQKLFLEGSLSVVHFQRELKCKLQTEKFIWYALLRIDLVKSKSGKSLNFYPSYFCWDVSYMGRV